MDTMRAPVLTQESRHYILRSVHNFNIAPSRTDTRRSDTNMLRSALHER